MVLSKTPYMSPKKLPSPFMSISASHGSTVFKTISIVYPLKGSNIINPDN